jgi:hypothetical protein
VACGARILVGGCEFVLDDGADEFAGTRMLGSPAFDHDGNVAISVMARALDAPERGCSLWIAHDLSMIAVEDEVCFF